VRRHWPRLIVRMRLLKLVNTLLDFSRIEAGRIVASYEPTDVSALTAELASVFRSAIERAGMKLVIDCPPLAEAVYIDREMWEKIVLNLISNAFKFTFDGEIGVSLRQADAALSWRCATLGRAYHQKKCHVCSSVFTASKARAGAPMKAVESDLLWCSSHES
jgi:signal transduction histidine kinase